MRAAVVGTVCGESDYTAQDRAVVAAATTWLRDEAPRDRPWVAKVSLVTPHYPFTVPAEFLALYADQELPMPLRTDPREWDRHPAVDFYRRSCGLDLPLTPEETQRALRHYFGLVSFMDAQLGLVLDTLDDTGHADRTIVLYVSDHGELMGTDGIWFKGTMTENSVRIPAVLAGPGVPRGARCGTNVSLVDVYPTIVDALGLPTAADDAELPGRSLLDIASSGYEERTVFSEYHSANSASGGS
jgi:choline-sulfatase